MDTARLMRTARHAAVTAGGVVLARAVYAKRKEAARRAARQASISVNLNIPRGALDDLTRIWLRRLLASEEIRCEAIDVAPGPEGTVTLAVVLPDSSGATVRAVRRTLRSFKALVETGEVPTVQGQSHGLRSTAGNALIAFSARMGGRERLQPMTLARPFSTDVEGDEEGLT